MREVYLERKRVNMGPLILVNAAHPLSDAQSPELVAPDRQFPGVLLERRAAGLLTACLQAVGGRGAIVPVSGWRSRAEQQAIWDSALAEHGEAFTRSYVALPGCSEHETGLAIDLGQAMARMDFLRPAFPDDGVCGAFRRVAARYGFIQRYRRDKEALTGIAEEPWHYRYVGVPHALLMEENGLCLEEYSAFLQKAPRRCRLSGGAAEVSYIPCGGTMTTVSLPDGCCQISGDNDGGFILTAWEVGP